MTNFHGKKAKKNFFFEKKKKLKMADSKKVHFSKSPILKIFLWKFLGFVLGLVGLIDAKGIDLSQPICLWDCLKEGQKQPKNTNIAFFACFCPYVRQPHNHIGWATFASINSTDPRTNLWNFREKISRIGDFGNKLFFQSAILKFFFLKRINFFCFILM